MATILPCPSCGTRLQIPATVNGAAVRCPACKSQFGPAAASPQETRLDADGPPATLPAEDLALLRMDKPGPSPRQDDRPRFPGYEVLGLLGKGGMGEVYKARHLRLDRVVALKVIRAELLNDADLVRRFRQEARAAARLAHPNIVTIYDSVEAAGAHFLALEFVEGADLATLTSRRGPLPAAQACDYIRQAALGLQHAHERGLVHRDIKPHNLLATADGGVVKIVDLGLALLQSAGASAAAGMTLTRAGVAMGTPAYLAPEQAIDAHRVDARADVYGLGCTFYHLLAGRPPFAGRSLNELAAQHRWVEAEPLEKLRPDLPLGLEAILRRMTAKRPEDRYQTAGEVAAVLRPYCLPEGTPTAPALAPGAEGIAAPTASFRAAAKIQSAPSAKPATRPSGRRGWAWLVGASAAGLLVVMVLALVVVVAWAFRPREDAANQPVAGANYASGHSESHVETHTESTNTTTGSAFHDAPPRDTLTDTAPILADLKSGDQGRILGATIILRAKAPARPDREIAQALEEQLAHGNNLVRFGAAGALIHWATPESAPVLVQALDDDNMIVRNNVMDALAGLKAESAFRPIARKFATLDRIKAGEVLRAIGPAAEAAVIEQAEDNDLFARQEVCNTLKEIGTEKSVATLNALRNDPQALVRYLAEQALKAIAGRK